MPLEYQFLLPMRLASQARGGFRTSAVKQLCGGTRVRFLVAEYSHQNNSAAFALLRSRLPKDSPVCGLFWTMSCAIFYSSTTPPGSQAEREKIMKKNEEVTEEVEPEMRYWMNEDTGRVIAMVERPGYEWFEIDFETYDSLTRPGARK